MGERFSGRVFLLSPANCGAAGERALGIVAGRAVPPGPNQPAAAERPRRSAKSSASSRPSTSRACKLTYARRFALRADRRIRSCGVVLKKKKNKKKTNKKK
jgi:hypothetical protein